MTKEEIKQKEAQLLELTKGFCDIYLDDDYLQLSHKLIKKLGRKRDVPFQRGKLEIWASAVIHALGTINFLFDKSFEPYSTPDQICDYFGTKKSTVSNKGAQIRELLKISYFDPDFSTNRMAQNNPMNKLVMVDGFLVPLNSIPPNLQEMVRNVRAKGEDIEFFTQEAN